MRLSGSTPKGVRGIWAMACVAAALAVLCPVADAQLVENIVVAVDPENEGIYTAFGYEVFPSVTEAVTEAISRARAAYQHYTVLVDEISSPWEESLTVPADADITIRGSAGPGTIGTPENAIIQSPDYDLPALEVVPPDAGNEGLPTNRLIIESLTLTGGSNGALVRYGQPSFNRVYLFQNAGSGIVTQEEGTYALLVNCSIAENGWDGISVEANSFADVLFCSVIDNARAGAQVYSAAGGDARIRNTIVFKNGEAGLRWDEEPDEPPVLVKNDVFLNPDPANDQNYVNITDPGDFIGVDPSLDPDGSWVGKLDAANAVYNTYTVVDRAASIYLLPFAAEDFEGQIRPWLQTEPDTPFDIGADEISVFDARLPTWYICRVRVKNVEQYFIPRSQPGEVEVEIRVAGNDEQPDVWFVPETGSMLDPTTWIEFTVTTHAGAGIWYAENTNLIDTIHRDTGTVANEPDAGDVLSDGHGVFILVYGDEILGDEEHDPILEQAATGRHVVVDTVPPVMLVTVPSFAPAFVQQLNTAFDYRSGATIPSLWHPGDLPGFSGGWLPNTVAAPYDSGAIDPYSPAGVAGFGATMFFNVGSRTNWNAGVPLSNETHLNLQVDVEFIDPPVLDPDGDPLIESVSGFPPGTDTLVLVDGLDRDQASPYKKTPAKWAMTFAENALLNGIRANLVYTSSGTNLSWDPEQGVERDLQNNETHVTWTFEDPDGTPGIGTARVAANGYTMDLAARFRGVDRAGNETPDHLLLEPLRLVWNLGVNSVITPNRDGQQVAFPNFTIGLDPRWPASSDVDLQPLFTYKLYAGRSIDGPYDTVIQDWTPWFPSGAINLSNAVPTLPQGTWILMVSLGADSGGNVEAWPGYYSATEIIDPAAPDFRTLGFRPASNWHRFQLSGGAIDTAIEPFFWHNDLGAYNTTYGGADPQAFGAQSIIPSPANLATTQVEGTFTFTAEAQDLTKVAVEWRISLDGQIVNPWGAPQSLPVNASGRASITLPGTAAEPDERLEDAIAPREPRNWVIQAWAYVDENNNGKWDEGELIDPTPATFAFTVVPETSMQQYIRNAARGDRQPIKIQQEQ